MMNTASAMLEPGDRTARPAANLLRLQLLLLVLFGLAYALFSQNSASWNTLCRAAMTANLVQHGRVDINGYESFTDDKAFRDGVYHCDKAPGMSFLAMPAAAAFTSVVPITPEKTYSAAWTAFLLICAVTTSGILCAAAALLLFRWLLQRTGSIGAALVGAIAFGLGTQVWGWATSFFSHAATAALLVMGFIAFDATARRLAAARPTLLFALLTGLALGGATATEYTALPAALIIGAGFAAVSPWRRPLDVVAMFAFVALGAIIALIPVLVYNAVAFGSPFTAGYAYTVVFDAHRTGLFGIGLPDPELIGRLLVSAERGIVWYAPAVLVMGWAVGRMAQRRGMRVIAAVTTGVALWYLLMNAGFGYWQGGESTGPRYLTPGVALGALALGVAWPAFGKWERRTGLVLLSLSVLINFACTAVDMTAGGLTDKILPSLFAGELRHTLTYLADGRPGLIHFVLPVAVGCGMTWLIWRELRRLKAASSAAVEPALPAR
jgi:hypothetical protein